MNVDDDARDEGVEDGACLACVLLNPSAHPMRNHRLVFCNKCDSMIGSAQMQPETPSQCSEVCTYSTLRPDNLRRHMEAKHHVNNDVKDQENYER